MTTEQNIMPDESQFQSSFSLEDEYKEDPICPAGTYKGNVKSVKFDGEAQAIVWSIVLTADNEGYLTDGETEIAGSECWYRNWLPKPGDENERTKNGRNNKRQSKINMMRQFAEGMDINMDTPSVIADSITNGLWIGIPVFVKLAISEYEGRIRNEVKSMTRDPQGELAEFKDDDIPF